MKGRGEMGKGGRGEKGGEGGGGEEGCAAAVPRAEGAQRQRPSPPSRVGEAGCLRLASSPASLKMAGGPTPRRAGPRT